MSKKIREWTRKFSAEYQNLNEVCEFVGEAARECGFHSEEVYYVQAAVDEAFSNIVEHAVADNVQEEIECTCRIDPTRFIISLSDYGNSFDPEQVPLPQVKAPLHQREKGGLGLFFMRHWMDEINFNVIQDENLECQRNVLTMIKKRTMTHD